MSGLPRPESVTSGSPVPSHLVLSRIILWVDSSPAYSASPPASESALSSLDRQTVDQKTLETEGQAHCAVCLDDLKVGATGVILSCKHMFHEECIVRWLKEHNTCPICRRSVKSRTRVGDASGQGPDNDSPDVSRPRSGSMSGNMVTAGSPVALLSGLHDFGSPARVRQ